MTARFTGDLRCTVFFAAGFLGATFFTVGFRRADFFAAGFLRTTFFAAGFRRADFFVATFRREDFFAAGFLRVDFFVVDFRPAFFAVFLLPAFLAAIGTLLDKGSLPSDRFENIGAFRRFPIA